jgi:hypothetical protein
VFPDSRLFLVVLPKRQVKAGLPERLLIFYEKLMRIVHVESVEKRRNGISEANTL